MCQILLAYECLKDPSKVSKGFSVGPMTDEGNIAPREII